MRQPTRGTAMGQYIIGGGYDPPVEGAQVHASVTPRDDLSLDRVIGYVNRGADAPVGYPPDSPPFRPAQYNLNRNGLQTSDTWQDFHYPNEYRNTIRDWSTHITLQTRLGLRDRADRRPIAIQQYALNTKAAAPGTYVATVPRGGG
jgi:hypothetical protein